MATTTNKGTKKSAFFPSETLSNELHKLQLDFTNRLNDIRKRYFIDGSGLVVINGNDDFDVSFYIDLDSIKTPSLS